MRHINDTHLSGCYRRFACSIETTRGGAAAPPRRVQRRDPAFIPIRLDNGDWLLPVFYCHSIPGKKWNGDEDTRAAEISSDAGTTTTFPAAAAARI